MAGVFDGDFDLGLDAPPDADRLVVADVVKVRRAMVDVLSARVVRFGVAGRVDDYVNFRHIDIQSVVSRKGVFLLSAWCQGDKSSTAGAIANIQQRLTGTPQTILSADKKGNIDELCGKLAYMRHVGVELLPINNNADVNKLVARAPDFLCGRLVPIAQTNGAQLRRLNEAYDRLGVADLTLYLDEIDDVWTNHPESNTSTSREREIRALLGMTQVFMGAGNRVQKVVFITATQATNVWLCDILGVQPQSFSASEDKLRARGYAGPEELIPWHESLDPACHNKTDMYCIDTPEVAGFCDAFDRVRTGWRLMLVSLTPFVGAESGCYDIACNLARRYPHWFIVTKSAEGVRRFQVADDAGTVHGDLLLGSFCDIVNRLDATPGGAETAVVEIAHALRGSSERSDRRVQTHLINALTKGMNSSTGYQNAGRGWGRTVVQRRANGYPGILQLSFAHDAVIVKGLDAMTATAAASLPGMADAEYAHEHRPIFGEKRPLMRKQLKFPNKRARFADPVVVAAAPEPVAAAPEPIVAAVTASDSDAGDPDYVPDADQASTSVLRGTGLRSWQCVMLALHGSSCYRLDMALQTARVRELSTPYLRANGHDWETQHDLMRSLKVKGFIRDLPGVVQLTTAGKAACEEIKSRFE